MSSESQEDDLGIKTGTVIDSVKCNYTVISLLGEGGFGAVYKVHEEKDKTKEFAMKVEKKLDTRKHSKLKMEIAILKLVSSLRADRSHFTKIVDRGKKANYFFLVMQLVGKSLADLKKARPNKVFSIGTGLGVAIQCLEAVEDLHTQGFIHRDLKPANYACGLGQQKHVIYILDFGIARKIIKKGQDLKTPRAVVGFKGTVRFASLACHRSEDMSMKDDCESWFYLLMDLILASGLPWQKWTDKNDVKDMKIRSRNEKSVEFGQLYQGVEKGRVEFVQVLTYIDTLTYPATPDYGYIYTSLKDAATRFDVKIDDPYDWEEPEQKTKRQDAAKAKS